MTLFYIILLSSFDSLTELSEQIMSDTRMTQAHGRVNTMHKNVSSYIHSCKHAGPGSLTGAVGGCKHCRHIECGCSPGSNTQAV